MDLTLFPLAAILLLLSGLSAPVRSAVQQAAAIASMREIFGTGQATTDHRAGTDADRGHVFAHYAAAAFPAARQSVQVAGDLQPGSVADSHRQPLFRTRFGHARGAYRAMAPPCA